MDGPDDGPDDADALDGDGEGPGPASRVSGSIQPNLMPAERARTPRPRSFRTLRPSSVRAKSARSLLAAGVVMAICGWRRRSAASVPDYARPMRRDPEAVGREAANLLADCSSPFAEGVLRPAMRPSAADARVAVSDVSEHIRREAPNKFFAQMFAEACFFAHR